ncbi:MAG: type II toxin-antitoxin system VapC family toxin [Nitrospirae bacterium]|nr:type II toxin-antitoxin system VapC family toxin [Nitrospirota bacterium]MBF0533963.1 type II toxin-antitoxin system VapC family toxin [Nitrospirota bacterium]MBF0616122.1 type II toxin-antitoxin system VapC family toxin [Nitrospirota bacterium]
MRALLDTHTFLWWITDSSLLSDIAVRIISDAKTELYLSSVSVLEMVIKAQIGKLTLPDTPEIFITSQMVINSIQCMPMNMNHAFAVYTLPMHHRDPFDRLLVAQAQSEELPIITNDQFIKQYGVTVIW